MALKITASDASEIGPGIWSFDMPPHQVRYFGSTSHAIGTQSVLIIKSCEYDSEKKQLHFNIEDVAPINIGTTSRVIGVAFANDRSGMPDLSPPTLVGSRMFGPGDREFLQLAASELTSGTALAAEALLQAVRLESPGDLRRGQSRNFSETPDNFWYVIVQPRIDELSITVRGPVSHFEPLAELEIKDDRGNTRFKVRNQNDVQAALKLIFHAVRKS